MAHTARDEEGTKEFFDSPEDLQSKARVAASWIRESQHFIAFTGAGISTACGVPDFRSGINTCLETGAGAWELRAKGLQRSNRVKTTDTIKAIPSFTHMSLVRLRRAGVLKHLVSQNTDGLHRRSGIAKKDMSELHGNSTLERCSQCSMEFLRDFKVRNAEYVSKHCPAGQKHVFFHDTGRACASCGGMLQDSIINFGENLPSDQLEQALCHAAQADLCLSLGSSLTVSPANQIPQISRDRTEVNSAGGRLIICNLQRTALDRDCDLRVFARCDEFMKLVMRELELAPSAFKLRRRMFVERCGPYENGSTILKLKGIDASSELPFQFIKSASLHTTQGLQPMRLDKQTGEWSCMCPISEDTRVTLSFFGHYKEPDLLVTCPGVQNEEMEACMLLEFDPLVGEWEVHSE